MNKQTIKVSCCVIVLSLLFASISCSNKAHDKAHLVHDTFEAGSFPLVHNGKSAVIIIDESDAEVMRIAAEVFADDVKLVTNCKPEVVTNQNTKQPFAVYIGTYGKHEKIKKLAEQGKLDCSHINNNQWESFIITVVDEPFDEIKQALVIAGSDRRGTAYGIFELSQLIGVSPWVWWADVLPEKKENIFIKKGLYEFGPPSVKYRGIFLNDEDWGLKPWAANNYEPETGDIGPKTYAKIFELLLRLKANFCWPAMHGCTKPFNHFPDNKVVADRYAIVMGSSHCEPLLFNNTSEWDKKTMGNWRYDTNRDGIRKVLDNRVKENSRYENVYTVGLRGIHDSGMAGETLDDKTRFLAQAIKDQRQILTKYIDKPVTEIPQVFIPYKEVLPLFENGLDVPEDVALMWADDNYGFIRQFSNPQQQKRPGGGGIYHHISYLGSPHSYLWLNTTPPALIWKEIRRAWDTNARNVWITNVGDIKPTEVPTEFFLQMAWDIDKWNEDNLQNYLIEIAARDFGPQYSREIAGILSEYYRLNFPRKPEYMDFQKGWRIRKPVKDPEFSLWNYGDECEKQIQSFDRLYEKAKQLGEKIPAHKKDAYFQLVLYPVAGSARMNKKILYAYKSRMYARQGRLSANRYADMARKEYEEIIKITDFYNNEIADGKWNHMMSYEPMKETVFLMPPVSTCEGSNGKGFAVALEGQESLLTPSSDNNKLPVFNRYTKQKSFIDLVAVNNKPVSWKIQPSVIWIKCSKDNGVLNNDDERVWIEIDYDNAPRKSDLSGKIKITSEDVSYDIAIDVFNEDQNIDPGTFIQDNNVISINAENYVGAKSSKLAKWKTLEGLGYSGKAVGLFPFTGWYIDKIEDISNNCPVLEYPIYVIDAGKAKLRIQAIPAFPIVKNRPLICGVSIGKEKPTLLTFQMGQSEGTANKKQRYIWEENVLKNAMYGEIEMEFSEGEHVLKIWGTDPSIIVDKILVDFGSERDSYFGPLETKVKNSS
ncbi:MAG: glycosyl hydrolase 115 family protein [Sedimentisphaerales bacterium]|nr:glycosyl hydrolase 115 family protein [Sedimentisphaerales bacterium]